PPLFAGPRQATTASLVRALRAHSGGRARPRLTALWRTLRGSESVQNSSDLAGYFRDKLHAVQGFYLALGPVEAQDGGGALVIDFQALFQGFRAVVGPDRPPCSDPAFDSVQQHRV